MYGCLKISWTNVNEEGRRRYSDQLPDTSSRYQIESSLSEEKRIKNC